MSETTNAPASHAMPRPRDRIASQLRAFISGCSRIAWCGLGLALAAPRAVNRMPCGLRRHGGTTYRPPPGRLSWFPIGLVRSRPDRHQKMAGSQDYLASPCPHPDRSLFLAASAKGANRNRQRWPSWKAQQSDIFWRQCTSLPLGALSDGGQASGSSRRQREAVDAAVATTPTNRRTASATSRL